MVFTFASMGRAARAAIRLLVAPGQATRSAGVRGRSTLPAAPASVLSSKADGRNQESRLTGPYPGDYQAGPDRLRLRYAPSPDGNPDPGEIVWTWVPFQEDFSRGKDRPVLIIGSAGGFLLALMLTSKDPDGGRAPSADYVDVGSGAWDGKGRPSAVKLDRILRIREADIRREGAVLGETWFRAVSAGLAERNGWPSP